MKTSTYFYVGGPIVFNLVAIVMSLTLLSETPELGDYAMAYILGVFSGATGIGVFVAYLRDSFHSKKRIILALLTAGFTTVLLFAVIFEHFGLIYGDSQQSPIPYFDALYFSIVTLTTLGYGDIQPATELRLLAAIQAIYGYTFLGLSIAAITKRKS